MMVVPRSAELQSSKANSQPVGGRIVRPTQQAEMIRVENVHVRQPAFGDRRAEVAVAFFAVFLTFFGRKDSRYFCPSRIASSK